MLYSLLKDFNSKTEPIQWQVNTTWMIAHFLSLNFNITVKNEHIILPGLKDLVRDYRSKNL